jgi:hypothetical protein
MGLLYSMSCAQEHGLRYTTFLDNVKFIEEQQALHPDVQVRPRLLQACITMN